MIQQKKLFLKSRSAFSIIEISVVILIIGLLVAGVAQAQRMVKKAKVTSARSAVVSSPVNFIKDLNGWYDTVMENSFVATETDSATKKISRWGNIAKTSADSVNGDGSQGTSDSQPVYVDGSMTTLPQLTFDGGDAISLPDRVFPTGNGVYTFFAVVAPTNSGTLFSAGGSGVNTKFGFDADSNFTIDGGGTLLAKTKGFNVMQTISYTYDGTDNKVWIDGIPVTVGGTASAKSTGAGSITIGSTSSGFRGNVGEVIVFARNLDDGERQDVEKYLKDKWKTKASGAANGFTSSSSGTTCSAFSTRTGGSISTSGGTATLTCSSGYVSSGNATATCSSGAWSQSLGSCVASCAALTAPSGGSIAISNSHSPAIEGDTATLTCSGGSPIGNSTATCTNGNWSQDLGTCINATGGTITYICDGTVQSSACSTSATAKYKVHTFTSSGTLTVSGGSISSIDYLVVAGGGGGGGTCTSWTGAGGGGAGGMLTGTFSSLAVASYPVTVGAGGAGGTGSIYAGCTSFDQQPTGTGYGTQGGQSTISTITAIGGGGGAGAQNAHNGTGGTGGSGGAGTRAGNAGSGSSGQGNSSGNTSNLACITSAPGGGGKGGVGGNGCSGISGGGGIGGIGASSSISGTATYYAGGGGGGVGSGGSTNFTRPGGSGGNGGGGSGATLTESSGAFTGANGTAGTANTGGGGGGGSYSSSAGHTGGSGGSGIVIVRYAY
jgi:type II secretory pathway pseudopilin PulG